MTEIQHQFFSKAYAEARQKFLSAAEQLDLIQHEAFIHPLKKDSSGEDLAVDVIRLGSMEARSVLLLSSGLHGVEGYLGSALQTQYLKKWAAQKPDDIAVVLVHAINPHGFDKYRRVNEDNVDLNRNFLDWSQPLPDEHPLSQDIQQSWYESLASVYSARAIFPV